MAGREKKVLYQYDLNGKFINKFDSISDFRRSYFKNDKGKRPLLVNVNWQLLKDCLISSIRIDRDIIVKIVKSKNNPFILKRAKEREINVYNIEHEKIGEFKTLKIASLLSGVPENTIYYQLKKNSNIIKNNKGLLFKYK